MENKEKLVIEASEYLDKWVTEHKEELDNMFKDVVLFGAGKIHIENEDTD